jgi:hypothetical protein
MNDTVIAKRAAWWDLVGLAFTRDKRFLVVFPCMYLAAWSVSHILGAVAVADSLFEAPHLFMH